MPIDVSPPMPGNLQGFQIAPVQSTDPLQTLAQMSQLRTQGLQQQQAQLGITQAQQKMDSNRAIMQSLIDGGGDWDKTDAAMRTHPEILPEDYAMVREHAIKALTDRQALDKGQLDIQDREHKNWASLFEGAKTQDDVNNVVAAGLQQGYKPPPNFVDEQGNLLHNFVGPDAADQIAAYRATLLLPQDLSEEKLKTQQTLTSKAEAEKAGVEAANLKTTGAVAQRQLAVDQLNAVDPNDPAAYKAWVAAHPEIKDAPGAYDLNYVARQNLSTVPAKDQPEYQIKLSQAAAMKAFASQDPTKIDDLVDSIVPKTDPMNAKTKVVLHNLATSGGTMQQVQEAIKDAYDQQGRIAADINPDVQAAKLKLAEKEAQYRYILPLGATGLPTVAPGGGPGAAPPLSGQEFLNSLPPGTAAQVRAIAEGRDNMPSAGSRAPTAAALRNAVFQYDPTFNEQRAQIRKAFATGPDGRNIGNLNTATVHLDQFYDAAMALRNGTFQPGNAAWNSLRTMFGSNMPTNFEALKTAVSGEMANALKGVATDPEIASIKTTLDKAQSPDQLAGVVKTNIGVLGTKLNTYLERAQQQDVGNWSPVLPSARSVFQKHGMDPTKPVQQGGPAAQQYTKYGKDPKTGHRIGLGADNKWHDVISGTVIQ
jgi:hypothetical protein